MEKHYVLVVVGREGMYARGRYSATPDLARRNAGNLQRKAGDILGVAEYRRLPGMWTDSAGNAHERYADPVLVEIESAPGEWQISGSTFGQ